MRLVFILLLMFDQISHPPPCLEGRRFVEKWQSNIFVAIAGSLLRPAFKRVSGETRCSFVPSQCQYFTSVSGLSFFSVSFRLLCTGPPRDFNGPVLFLLLTRGQASGHGQVTSSVGLRFSVTLLISCLGTLPPESSHQNPRIAQHQV